MFVNIFFGNFYDFYEMKNEISGDIRRKTEKIKA